MTRFEEIAEELKSAAAAKKFTMPETLEECATARENTVRSVLREIREGADPLPFARFFDILYTDEDVSRFTDAFAEAAPEEYIQSSDLDSGSPWCMPWLWESDPLTTAKEGDTPESLARRYVEENVDAIRQAFHDWKEEECAQISQDLWEAYHGNREAPDEYIHQSELFGEAFDALDALKDESGADEIVDRYAEEIFYARA